MGCGSSSLNYGDVYEEICGRLGLTPEEMRCCNSTEKAIRLRSNTFAIIGSDIDPETGAVRTVGNAEPPFLPAPKPVSATKLAAYMKQTWKLANVHPLCSYFALRTVTTLNDSASHEAAQAGADITVTAEEELRRTEYRLWLLAMCEVFHVLSVLQDHKGIPKAALKWLKKTEKIGAMNSALSTEGDTPLVAELKALQIGVSDLKPKVVQQLRREFPGVPSLNTTGTTAVQLISFAQRYGAAKNAQGAGKGVSNPLQTTQRATTGPDTVPFSVFVEMIVMGQVRALRGKEEDPENYAKAQELPDEEGKEAEEEHEVAEQPEPEPEPELEEKPEPEPEPEPESELEEKPEPEPEPELEPELEEEPEPELEPELEEEPEPEPEEEPEEAEDKEKEDSVDSGACTPRSCAPSADAAVSSHAGGDQEEVAMKENEEPHPPDTTYALADLLAWGTLLTRYEEVEKELVDMALAGDDSSENVAHREELQREKDLIAQRLKELYDLISKRAGLLGRAELAQAMWELFNLVDVFGEAGAADHRELSDIAFDECVGENCDTIDTAEQLYQYVGLYVHLYGMYKEIREARAAAGDQSAGVDDLTREEVSRGLAALPPNQRRQVALATSLFQSTLANSDGAPDDPFQLLFDLLAEPSAAATASAADDTVHFAALSRFVAHAIAHGEPNVGLRDLLELKRHLGLDEEGGAGKARSAAFVARCCCSTQDASFVQAAEFVAAVRREARLAQFTPSTESVAAMATGFSAGASAFSSDSSTITETTTSAPQEWVTRMLDMATAHKEGSESEHYLILSSFYAHALYNTTAAFRCLAESRPADVALAATRDFGEEGVAAAGTGGHGALPSSAKTVGHSLSAGTLLTRKWFNEAVPRLAELLGCQASALLDDAGRILSRRPDGAILGEAARTVKRRKVLSSSKNTQDKLVLEEDEATALDRAFSELAAVDHAAGMHGTTVILEDLVYVCLFNAVKPYFGEEPLFNSFLKIPSPFNWADLIASLLLLLPLGDEAKQYRDFFAFSEGKRSIAFDFAADENDALDRFARLMYQCYATEMSPIVGSQDRFAKWLRDAVGCVKGQAGELTARDYSALLEYLAGQFIAFAKHKEHKAASVAVNDAASGDGDAAADEDVGHDSVRRKFVEELILFPQGEDSSSTETREMAAATAKRVFTELQLHEMEERNGDVSLDSVAAWYGAHRVANLASDNRSQMERWLQVAEQLPYTSSTEHRQARGAIVSELGEEQKRRLTLGEMASVSDGYLPSDLLVSQCIDQYTGDDVPLMPSHPDTESWLRECVGRTNGVVGRPDLGDAELHEQDLRFFFEFAHHDMTAFCSLEETEKEHRTILVLQKEGRLPPSSCDQTETTLHAALERCLCEELKAPSQCVDELLRDNCASCLRSDDGTWDSECVSHHVAANIVAHDHSLFLRARREHRESVEVKAMELYDKELLLGRNPQDAFGSRDGSPYRCGVRRNGEMATYWERLRHLLPHGDSERQRALRQRLWNRMDIRDKGYVTLADLNRCLHDDLRLHEFREDLAPVLFRAFFATTEMFNTKSDVIYLTSVNEQFLIPSHFCTFLSYLYSYMELYFMFDVLTCSGYLDANMQVKEAAIDPTLGGGAIVSTANRKLLAADSGILMLTDSTAPVAAGADGAIPKLEGDVLFEASLYPYAIMKASNAVRKQVTLSQFQAAVRLLRHWGARVNDTERVFRDINRRAKETGEMHFTGFAIWASEKGLHPEGYGHDFTEDADEVAQIEASFVTA